MSSIITNTIIITIFTTVMIAVIGVIIIKPTGTVMENLIVEWKSNWNGCEGIYLHFESVEFLTPTLSLKPQSFFCMPGALQVCCGVYNCASECMWAESVHVNAAERWMESVWEADVGNCSCQSVSGQMESNLEQQLDVSNSISEISLIYLAHFWETGLSLWLISADFGTNQLLLSTKRRIGTGVKITFSSFSQKYHEEAPVEESNTICNLCKRAK